MLLRLGLVSPKKIFFKFWYLICVEWGSVQKFWKFARLLSLIWTFRKTTREVDLRQSIFLDSRFSQTVALKFFLRSNIVIFQSTLLMFFKWFFGNFFIKSKTSFNLLKPRFKCRKMKFKSVKFCSFSIKKAPFFYLNNI